MQFDIESARRLDDQNVEMHTVTIQTYNQQTFKPDAKIDLISSTMNLDTEVDYDKGTGSNHPGRFFSHGGLRRIQFKNSPGNGVRKYPSGDL